ncbi:vWA domain-containing protein [Deinococcus maricopensis]|uniref:Uncharacterized protein n=1 Tax=Deinococcus maricopensis (strain DSM 21211 / LMG 22137 / NRRL B-23946 / LB-34) TaxID=709986 RepID=E8U900_DEIML|nr:VWA-like domain-containing protein [Deinococcus maricopensis]ADV67539.1 Protein of unknown function DUF2201, metallopeptidase-related protein [Deinococcus maricopensis DSM 21211]
MAALRLAPDEARAFDRAVSGARLRLRGRSAFFATLMLHARIVPSREVSVAATDGERVYLNPDAAERVPRDVLDGLLLHEVLHAALSHVPRRGPRERERWNAAADVVVNGMIAQSGLPLPERAARAGDLEHLSVEEVYAALVEHDLEGQGGDDLLDGPPGDAPEDGKGRGHPAANERAWRQAVEQARAVASMAGQGDEGLGAFRELARLRAPQLDWRAHLWRFLTRTPVDFGGFDRRFAYRGLYLEALDEDSLRVLVGVDTSGSIDEGAVAAFLGEIQGIQGAYPHVQVTLYYADAALYGPFEWARGEAAPPMQGGGGTDFRPLLGVADQGEHDVLVYLTDGFGEFSVRPPQTPVLWVVLPGGLEDGQFPFGEVARLAEG